MKSAPSDSMHLTLTRSREEIKGIFYALKTRRDVANLLEVDYGTLIFLLYRSESHPPYRKFNIKKKSGGLREISAPTSSLKILQKKLDTILRAEYAPRDCTFGFCEGKSIVDHARRHAGQRYIFNLDLKDFFSTIHIGRVIGLFKAKPFNFTDEVAITLAQLCCCEGLLPQGAPTSPVLSNMICLRLDRNLQELAKRFHCLYTRYADDITFSSRSKLRKEVVFLEDGAVTCGAHVKESIERNGFVINSAKLRLQNSYMHQEVTGLTINLKPNVTRSYIRQIRVLIHMIGKYGLSEAGAIHFSRSDSNVLVPRSDFKSVVLGKLEFVKFVKGESDPVYRRLRNSLFRHIAPEVPPLPILMAENSVAADYIDEALRQIGPQLPIMRRGMWAALTAAGPDAGRQAAHSARELIDQTLKEGALPSHVTRKQRAKYIIQRSRGSERVSSSDLNIITAQCAVVEAEDKKLMAFAHGRIEVDLEEVRRSLFAAERVLELLFIRGD